MTGLYTVETLASDLDIDRDRAKRVLGELEAKGIVERVDGDRWEIKSRLAACVYLARVDDPPVHVTSLPDWPRAFGPRDDDA